YKRNDYMDALKKFQAAVRFAPKHELAAQYLELTQSKLQVAADRLLFVWQKDFDAHQYAQAAMDYKAIKTSTDGGSAQMLQQVQTQYRAALTDLVDQWNRACPKNNQTVMNDIRNQIGDLLPEPSFGEDLRNQMSNCSKPSGCVQASSALAMTRLKQRV